MVFANLARQAASLPDGVVLAGWLHRDARYTALDLLHAERRRQARELEIVNTPDSDPDWEQVRPWLAWGVTARAWFWPFQARHGILRVAESSRGVFRAEFDFPEQDANHQPVAVIYHPPGVELAARSGAGMFKGKVNPEHTKITGHFVQGHYSVGATLRRSGGNGLR